MSILTAMTDPISIEPVQSRRQRREFLRLPWRIYASDRHWVPPLLSQQRRLLDPTRHPFYRHARSQLFLALRGGEAVGRIVAIVDELHNAAHDERTGFFGFFESVDDAAVAERLLHAAHHWVHEQGMQVLRGPVNPSTNYECGLLVEGFDQSPMIMMPYNPPYYLTLLEQLGMKKGRDLYAYWLDRSFQMPEKVGRVAQRVMRRPNVRIRAARLKDFHKEVADIRSIYNAAWRPNWGFVPVTDEEFEDLTREIQPILLPEFALLAEIDGEVVGFLLALPNINEVLAGLNGRLLPFGWWRLWRGLRRIQTLRVPLMGFLPEHQNLGLAAALYMELMRRALEAGYQALEMSWILEDNEMMNRTAQMLGAQRYKTYRLYERALA